MAKYALASKKATEKRRSAEEKGEHIPPFLIASITSSCNLHCAGCYSRANHACGDSAPADQMSADQWDAIFAEASDMGIGFIPLAGGEETTDSRRGKGVYQKLQESMRRMKESGILFGASVTVTTENMREVLSDAFITGMYEKGAKVIIYVEFVPVTEEAKRLASGGCLAAGRGFFHINSHGGAEPCPFSPYSDISVKTVGLRGAIDPPLFRSIQEQDLLVEDHAGGCVLFERREQVEALMERAAVG